MAVELNGKRLDLMKTLLPTVSRVTLLTNPIHPGEHLEVAESQRVAGALGISLQYLQVRTHAEFDSAFRATATATRKALLPCPIISSCWSGGVWPSLRRIRGYR